MARIRTKIRNHEMALKEAHDLKMNAAQDEPVAGFADEKEKNIERLKFLYDHSWFVFLDRINRVRFTTWYGTGAIILAIPLVVNKITNHQYTLRSFAWILLLAGVMLESLLGLVLYCLDSWQACHLYTQEDCLNINNYKTFFKDIQYSVTLLLWTIISRATVPVMCRFNHQHCQSRWISAFQKALVTTVVVSALWFIKYLGIELLYIRAAIVAMHKKQSQLEQAIYAIFLLATPRTCENSRGIRTKIGPKKEVMPMLEQTPELEKKSLVPDKQEQDQKYGRDENATHKNRQEVEFEF